MSKTPASASVDGYVRVASHLSNVPSIGTDAFTANLIELPSWGITKTGTPAGAWAGLTGKNNWDARRQVITRAYHIVKPPYSSFVRWEILQQFLHCLVQVVT